MSGGGVHVEGDADRRASSGITSLKEQQYQERINSIKTVFAMYFRQCPSAPPPKIVGYQRLSNTTSNKLPRTHHDKASTKSHTTSSSSSSNNVATSSFTSTSEGDCRLSYDCHLKKDEKLRRKCVVIMKPSKEVDDYERLRKADADREKCQKKVNQLKLRAVGEEKVEDEQQIKRHKSLRTAHTKVGW